MSRRPQRGVALGALLSSRGSSPPTVGASRDLVPGPLSLSVSALRGALPFGRLRAGEAHRCHALTRLAFACNCTHRGVLCQGWLACGGAGCLQRWVRGESSCEIAVQGCGRSAAQAGPAGSCARATARSGSGRSICRRRGSRQTAGKLNLQQCT